MRGVQAYTERGNGDRIKNFKLDGENHKFSTLIQLPTKTDEIKIEALACSAPIVFYSVIPKCDSRGD